jgi:hypothetical protein
VVPAGGWLAAAGVAGVGAAVELAAAVLPAAAAGGLGAVEEAAAELAAALALLRVREVRLAIAQVGRGWQNGVDGGSQ